MYIFIVEIWSDYNYYSHIRLVNSYCLIIYTMYMYMYDLAIGRWMYMNVLSCFFINI